jgi:hypothetical protein
MQQTVTYGDAWITMDENKNWTLRTKLCFGAGTVVTFEDDFKKIVVVPEEEILAKIVLGLYRTTFEICTRHNFSDKERRKTQNDVVEKFQQRILALKNLILTTQTPEDLKP